MRHLSACRSSRVMANRVMLMNVILFQFTLLICPSIIAFQPLSNINKYYIHNNKHSTPFQSRLYISSTTPPPPTSKTSSTSNNEQNNNSRIKSPNDREDELLITTTEVSTIKKSLDVDSEKSLLAKIYEKMGSIDEDRYMFPEYTSGEVPRVFSSLKYQASDDVSGKVIGVSHAAGSVVGAAALIAGTTVGAGVLALPAATAAAGFFPSTVAMFVAYGYMVVSGLLIAELTLNRMGTTGRPGTGLLDLYQNSLGTPVSQIGSVAYFFLHYAMMVAYIAQGGASVASLFPDLASTLPDGAGQAAFAAICGVSLFTASTNVIQKVNNVLVLGVVGTFLAIVSSAAGTADFSALIDSSNQHPEQIVNCFPILFLAFVYQNVVPTIVTQLEGDRWKIIYAILGGTAVPLIMFMIWNAVILGNVFASGIDPTTVDPVALLSSGALGSVGPLVTAFSITAVTTSIIGFTYGLVEAWKDMFQLQGPEGTAEFAKWKPALFALVFLPPLALSIADPTIFYSALEYGGTFGVSTLFLILPPIMVWNERYGDAQVPLVTRPLVPFGKIPLGSMWKAAGTLIIEQGAEKLGIFHWFQQQFHL
jgi:tyrosine-specific transport protein